MQKLLFLDRDGVLLVEPQPDQQVDSLEKLEFVPGAIFALARLVREQDFQLVLITNQDGLGTPSFPEENFWPAHNKMLKTLAGEGIVFRSVHIDRSYPHENLPTRKPGTALLREYLEGGFDLANSVVVGDRLTDVQLAKNLGARAVLLRQWDDPAGRETEIDCLADTWEQIYQYLRRPPRRVEHQRKTRETDIHIALNLDGSGQTDIQTGLGFFDHMLDQLGRHGMLDLRIQTTGDLHIDEHHSIEDTALALGEAFALALHDKRGLERYGQATEKGLPPEPEAPVAAQTIPMDEALASVALDFGGRPWLVWQAEFRREKIGDMPTEMFFHFFKSFSDAARCNLHIRVEGQNEHHKIEAIFKAFARAVRQAVRRDPLQDQLPS
ncbi:MAG: bifunctional histidinol-phosphatase/imidazoleglycerol-phosphate dehydratase HisB, partial [Saprospiraceae bacterium]|nr:bifunctional histidinol-phosphatase/imidazoleglycerol-phosphate dehydratase HisB [Saprospiraceae bacterium]